MQCPAAKGHTIDKSVVKRIMKHTLHNEKVKSRETILERNGTSKGWGQENRGGHWERKSNQNKV